MVFSSSCKREFIRLSPVSPRALASAARRPRSLKLAAKRGLLLHIKAEQQILVAQVQLAVGDDRMGPDRPAAAADRRLLRQLDATSFLPAFRRGLGDVDVAAALVVAPEV